MGFQEKLEHMKDLIIEEADGVTCDSCKFAVFDCGDLGFCAQVTNIHVMHGGAITISKWAPRCSKHVECQESEILRYKDDEIVIGCAGDISTIELST